MATISTGQSGGRRHYDHTLPLVPFIDFLLCLISFLLITAVWSEMGRINANANVPGRSDGAPTEEPSKELHVEVGTGQEFQVTWRKGTVVVDSVAVPVAAERVGDQVRYASLADEIRRQWERHEGRHYAATDRHVDRAVLHTANSTPFQELVAVMDAIHAPRRDWKAVTGEVVQRPAFDVVLAVN